MSLKISNCINLPVTTLRCKVAITDVRKFQDKKIFVAKSVAALNDFIIEDTDSADFQTNPTYQRSRSIWLWKVFNELLHSFPRNPVFTLVKQDLATLVPVP